jgi:hypothetical protein
VIARGRGEEEVIPERGVTLRLAHDDPHVAIVDLDGRHRSKTRPQKVAYTWGSAMIAPP